MCGHGSATLTVLFSLYNWAEDLLYARVLMRFLVLLSKQTVLCKQLFLRHFPTSTSSPCRNQNIQRKAKKKKKEKKEENNGIKQLNSFKLPAMPALSLYLF